MKLLFLDIDGVLNSHAFFATLRKNPPPSRENLRAMRKINRKLVQGGTSVPQSTILYDLQHIDPTAVAMLNSFLEETQAKVVISSTWRKTYPWRVLQTLLENFGFRGEIIGQTPQGLPRIHHGTYGSSSPLRGDEIQEWLDKWKGEPIAKLVILDDDSDMAHLSEFHIRTDLAVGLTREDVKRAVKLLLG